MRVSRGRDTRKQPGIVSARVVNAQSVLEIWVSAWIGRPAFRIFPTVQHACKWYCYNDFNHVFRNGFRKRVYPNVCFTGTNG